MRKVIALLAVVGAILTLHAGGVLAQEQSRTPQQNTPDRYIVVLNDNVQGPGQEANEHARRYDARVGFVYRHAIKGYSATIPDSRLRDLKGNPSVDYVERDGVATAVAQTTPWGIKKVGADVSSTVAGNGSGVPSYDNDLGVESYVNAYVIDSGIYRHSDLNVINHVNFAGGQNTDCNGHGTHVAGTVAARDNASDVVGVAPGIPLTGVKVLGCSGSGSYSGVIAGIDWVTANAVEPAVANMSLGGPANKAVDDAVTRSASRGITYAVAAGNESANACNSSPARAGAGTNNGILTVAATDSSDKEASFSNYGQCVDVWAPGVNVRSTKRGGGTTTMSGTSMASPHVAGAAALYLSRNPGATSVESAIKNAAVSTGTASKNGQAIKREYVGGF